MAAPYFTVEEFRNRFTDLTGAAALGKYPDGTVEAWRDTAEQAYEQAIRVALVPRTAVETVWPEGVAGTFLFLEHPRIRTITSIKDSAAAAVAFTAATVRSGYVELATGWPTGPLTVTYTHGHDEPPARDRQAVMLLTRVWVVTGPVDDRAVQVATDVGTIGLSTPGRGGAVFGIPEVDAAVAQWPRQQVTVG